MLILFLLAWHPLQSTCKIGGNMCRENFKSQKETKEGNTISMCMCTHVCVYTSGTNVWAYNDRNRCGHVAAMTAINNTGKIEH